MPYEGLLYEGVSYVGVPYEGVLYVEPESLGGGLVVVDPDDPDDPPSDIHQPPLSLIQ